MNPSAATTASKWPPEIIVNMKQLNLCWSIFYHLAVSHNHIRNPFESAQALQLHDKDAAASPSTCFPARSSSCSYLYSHRSTLHSIRFAPGIIKLSSYPQRALQNLSVASCFEVASPLSVVRLHRDARHGDLWERGVPLLAVVQPAGLRAVGAQRQGGSAHL